MNEQPETQSSEQAVISEIQEKRKFLYDKENPNRMLAVHDRIALKLQALEKKYPKEARPNARDFYLFHVLSGSTIDRQACSNFDFPGADSVAMMLEDIYREYQEAEQ